MKTKIKKKAAVRTPVKELTGKETIEHYNSILLEEIKSDVRAVFMATEDTKNSLKQEITQFREEVNDRFEIVETAITEHSKQIRGLSNEVKKHGEAIENLSGKVENLDHRVGGLEHKVDENGAAILRVEQKIDKIAVSVESHETRLTVVEEKIEGHPAVHP